jgi:hypothetical protein
LACSNVTAAAPDDEDEDDEGDDVDDAAKAPSCSDSVDMMSIQFYISSLDNLVRLFIFNFYRGDKSWRIIPAKPYHICNVVLTYITIKHNENFHTFVIAEEQIYLRHQKMY